MTWVGHFRKTPIQQERLFALACQARPLGPLALSPVVGRGRARPIDRRAICLFKKLSSHLHNDALVRPSPSTPGGKKDSIRSSPFPSLSAVGDRPRSRTAEEEKRRRGKKERQPQNFGLGGRFAHQAAPGPDEKTTLFHDKNFRA